MENYIQLSQQVVSGDVDALKAYIQLKQAEKEIAEAIKVVQPLAIDEADKYSGKTFQAFGAVIEKKNGASRWDYSQINAWQTVKNKLEYIQKIAQAGGGVDPETGQEIEKAAKIEGATTIAIKLIKEKEQA